MASIIEVHRMNWGRSDVNRRTVLKTVGVAGAITLAGCLENDPAVADDQQTDAGGDESDTDDENGDGEDNEEESVLAITGYVFGHDGSTPVESGEVRLLEDGELLDSHDLATGNDYELSGFELGEEYTLSVVRTARYPDYSVSVMPREAETDGDDEDDGPDITIEARNDPRDVVGEDGNITLTTQVKQIDSYEWDGRLTFRTEERRNEWIHRGERYSDEVAYVYDENLAISARTHEQALERIFLEDGYRVDPISSSSACHRTSELDGFPDWSLHQAIQRGPAAFDEFSYEGVVTIEDHPEVADGQEVHQYEVESGPGSTTFDVYVDIDSRHVLRIDGALDVDDIYTDIFESQLQEVYGTVDIFDQEGWRFIGVHYC